jgi:hypothetical protein
MFSIASVVTKLLAILCFSTKSQLQDIPGANAATWQQELAADFPSLKYDTNDGYGFLPIKQVSEMIFCKSCKYQLAQDAKIYLELRLIKLVPPVYCK